MGDVGEARIANLRSGYEAWRSWLLLRGARFRVPQLSSLSRTAAFQKRSAIFSCGKPYDHLPWPLLEETSAAPPIGFEGLIREMGEPAKELSIPPQPEAPPEEAEMQRMATIAARHGNEILGPPPGQ